MSKTDLISLKHAYKGLSQRYRGAEKNVRPVSMASSLEAEAYDQARSPATQSVLKDVIQQVNLGLVTSILDIGVGTGTSLHVLQAMYPYAHWSLIEPNTYMRKKSEQALLKDTAYTWYKSVLQAPLNDLVIISYVLNELTSQERLAFILQAFEKTRHFLFIILPGTPKDFALLLEARTILIEKKAFIWAPCPHAAPCPLQNQKDWCHFSVRLERSPNHKTIKEGKKGYEDEKYCYLIVSPQDSDTLPLSRIIKSPRPRDGHVLLDICTPEGQVKNVCLSQKKDQNYKESRRLKWGDLWRNTHND